MRCRTARRLMSLAMDRRIPREEESRLLEHVERCPRCRETWAAMLRAESLLKGAPLLEPPPTLVPGVLARLPSRRRSIAVVPPAWRRTGRVVGIAAGAVAVGALIAVVLLVAGWWPTSFGRTPEAWLGGLRDSLRAWLHATRPVAQALWDIFGLTGLLLAAGLALGGAALGVAFWRLGNRRPRG